MHRHLGTALVGAVLAVWPLWAAPPAAGAETAVAPGGQALAEAVAGAEPGDVLALAAGVYEGGVTIDKPLTLRGLPGAVVQGPGTGSVLRIEAPDVTVRGLTIRGSGTSLQTMDSGVFVGREGHRALVADNDIQRNLFGVYLWGPEEAVVRGNRILGRDDLRMSERGNGVSVWNSPGSRVEENHIRFGRDGIFTNTSRQNVFAGNRLEDLRFAIHYMYTNKSEVRANVSVGNHVGYAIMYSRGIVVRNNRSESDREHGIMMNYTIGSEVEGNTVIGGKDKCVFLYNATDNTFRNNWFEGCAIGIHFTAGSRTNAFSRNAFVGNQTQVKYVGTRSFDWSHDGVGNYWSDNAAFDLDGDGIADTAYRPNDLIDQVVWSVPLAKLLLNSPAVQVVRWAQAQFPSLTPGGVVDTAPLMRPSQPTAPAAKGGAP